MYTPTKQRAQPYMSWVSVAVLLMLVISAWSCGKDTIGASVRVATDDSESNDCLQSGCSVDGTEEPSPVDSMEPADPSWIGREVVDGGETSSGGGRRAPCTESVDCDSRLCVPTRYGFECSWDTGRGTCFHDRYNTEHLLPDIGQRFKRTGVSYCVYGLAAAGLPCESDQDCWVPTSAAGRLSLWRWRCTWTTGSPAFSQCSTSCPGPQPNAQQGVECIELGAEAGTWQAKGPFACPSSVSWRKAAGPCRRVNAIGACIGLATCSNYGPDVFPTCNAPEPTTETCAPNGKGDNIDQDCDGQTDEGCAP